MHSFSPTTGKKMSALKRGQRGRGLREEIEARALGALLLAAPRGGGGRLSGVRHGDALHVLEARVRGVAEERKERGLGRQQARARVRTHTQQNNTTTNNNTRITHKQHLNAII